MPNSYTLAFAKIGELAIKDGTENIWELPGCWERQVDENWRFHVNGHDEKIADSRNVEISPFHASVWYGEELAGIISPFDGLLIGVSKYPNPQDVENAFIDALQAALK